MKVSGRKLDQKLKELMVEKKFFMKKIIVKLASILKMIYPWGITKISNPDSKY